MLSLTACTATGSATPPPSAPLATTVPGAPLSVASEPFRLVALGDSYTAGIGVERRESWPRQLVRSMDHQVRLRLVSNLADVGKTSEDVLLDQVPQLDAWRPDVVSLLVGVNDIIANDITLDMYRANVAGILDLLLADLDPERIFVITSPDLTLTARGGHDYGDRAANRAAILLANAILTEEATARGIVVVDITPVSDRVPHDSTLVADDGLYPSAKQYAGWVELIAPEMERVLLGGQP